VSRGIAVRQSPRQIPAQAYIAGPDRESAAAPPRQCVGGNVRGSAALVGLGVADLRADPETALETLTCLLKTQEDRSRITREVAERLLGKVA